jgi:indole-3-glycerol phosphate synthase/phosphoribosylanthranilate isomerase
MSTILDRIVEHKKLEINQLYQQYDISSLKKQAELRFAESRNEAQTPLFYQALGQKRNAGQPFFISEFKRKSPSEGWINQHADLPAQLNAYTRAGASAISVLTDTTFFGGSYDDLKTAHQTLHHLFPAEVDAARPLLLQKDFILDPIQIYLAKCNGADLILLIAAILEPETLENLRQCAESLSLGVLVEVHDEDELSKIQHLNFPVLGVNNRDLKTFRTALNRVNALRKQAGNRFIIAESGVKDYRDFQIVRQADGFLIGTSLMQTSVNQPVKSGPSNDFPTFAERFQSRGRLLFKACGIRSPEYLRDDLADFIGVNFSPKSKRRYDLSLPLQPTERSVAVFYHNSEDEIREILAAYPFKTVQLYTGDVSLDFIKSLKQKVILACSIRTPEDLSALETFATEVDLFILDGAQPGSGQGIETSIPSDFPYPFLLAGGLHADNLEQINRFDHCIGVDIASGIETDGAVDETKIRVIKTRLQAISIHFLEEKTKV